MKNIKVTNPFLDTFDDKYYSFEQIQPLKNARIASINHKLCDELGFDLNKDDLRDILNGKKLLDGSRPFSMVYAGHQFGYRVPQLGDGRAMNIGTFNGNHLQLKGAGVTKYSRQGDGRAVLRSSIREYLMSEAMHFLNIPTTRALAIITSDHNVYREYGDEKGAIVLRSSSSWVRIGTFEFYFQNGTKKDVQKLADFVISQNYPHLQNENENQKYEKFYFELIDKSAKLTALWQSVGFMHGVLNSDNTSVDGITIDYGPYAFMDIFKKSNICNHTDENGRYSYENQPRVIQWNLGLLGSTLQELVDIKRLKEIHHMYEYIQKKYYYDLMYSKLGINKIDEKTAKELTDEILNILELNELDYTNFFYNLSTYTDKIEIINQAQHKTQMANWIELYENKLAQYELNKDKIQEEMLKINPKYVLKNYMIQDAIDLAQNDDFSLLNDLLEIAQNPFANHLKYDKYASSTPKKQSNLKLSCSS